MRRISYIDDFETWKNSFTFSIPIKVRFQETDMFGHMNNSSAFIYFEAARIEFFKEIQVMNNYFNAKQVPVVSDIQCDFLQQIYFDDKLDVYVKTHSVGNTSFDLHYMVKKENGDICLTGRGRIVLIDTATQMPVPITESDKKRLIEG